MPTHLYFIRHGDSISREVNGKMVELGLSPDGVAQAEKLRDRLMRSGELKPDVLLVSPAQRAQETAAIIAASLGQTPITDAAVDEWNAEDGTLTEDEFMSLWRSLPDSQKPFYRFTEGYETLVEFAARAHSALNRLLREHDGKTLAIITHGGIIQSAFAYFFGYSSSALPPAGIDVKKTAITHWYTASDGRRWILERFNDYAHLNP